MAKICLLTAICKVYERGGFGWYELKMPKDKNVQLKTTDYCKHLRHNDSERMRVISNNVEFYAYNLVGLRVFRKKNED